MSTEADRTATVIAILAIGSSVFREGLQDFTFTSHNGLVGLFERKGDL